MCLEAGFDEDEIEHIGEQHTRAHKPYEAGEKVSRAGDSVNRSLLVVKSGAVKSEMVTGSGQVRVTGFYVTGELFGFDALGARTVLADTIALTKTWVCELPLKQLESLCASRPAFQNRILCRLGMECPHRIGSFGCAKRYGRVRRMKCVCLSSSSTIFRKQRKGKPPA